MTRIGQIYLLADPREPNMPRYYGQTVKPLGTRLARHINVATNGGRRHVARWIRGLLLANLRPLIATVAYGFSREELDRLERAAIDQGRAQGFPLCNLTDGGGGAKGWKASAETRARMSAAARGPRKPRSVETRAKLSAANLGKRLTPEQRVKLSAALRGKPKRPRTPEHSAKIVAARERRPWLG